MPSKVLHTRSRRHGSIFARGCLECGTCRVVCPENNIEWNYPPKSGFGVQYRFG
ncbi:4Fe-4S dicluster domain-containing protein [Vulcanisaeta distributa]|uniref:4Fe-4S dicluster domain-containing protein n=1 Tax=Vulcanisaeta distributa TaxID=164451 RepID=UPI001FB3074D|nr:4Fe-4S dicluster domain-containing protein [Vulcanisaeta distributa]